MTKKTDQVSLFILRVQVQHGWCPCKQIGSVCKKYCHPNRAYANRQQKADVAEELICLSAGDEAATCTLVKRFGLQHERQHCWRRIKNVLMNGGWLNDKLIHSGMQLLKEAFPHLSGIQTLHLAHHKLFGYPEKHCV